LNAVRERRASTLAGRRGLAMLTAQIIGTLFAVLFFAPLMMARDQTRRRPRRRVI